MKASEVMVRPAVTLPETSNLELVARTLVERSIGSVLLVDESGALTGILTESDFMARQELLPFSSSSMPKLFGEWLGKESLAKIYQNARNLVARDFMRKDVVSVDPSDPIEEVVEKMLRADVRHMPVVEQGKPVGMIARKDLLGLMARVLKGSPT